MKGQFLVFATIIIGVVLMGTAVVVSDSSTEIEPSKTAHEIGWVNHQLESLDMTEKQDRELFRRLADQKNFEYDVRYNEQKDCTTVRVRTSRATFEEGCAILESRNAARSRYDIDSASFSGKTINTRDKPLGIAFSDDGSKMFEIGNKIHEYRLTKSYNLSTASYTGNSMSTENDLREVVFTKDGKKMFGAGSNKIYEYSLSTPYDLNTAQPSSDTVQVQDSGFPMGVAFGEDGSKMFEVGFFDGKIYEYSLTTPYDLSTAQFTGNSTNTQTNQPTGVAFGEDGSKMFEVGLSSDGIYEYSLTTPYDLSTAQYTGKSISSQDEDPISVAFNGDGSKMFEVGRSSNSIYEYELYVPFE